MMQVDSMANATQVVKAGQSILVSSVASYFHEGVCGKLRFRIDAAN